MVSTRNREIFWFCLALALAISLASVGGVILYDFYTGGSDSPGRISLHPGGGILAIIISATLLTLLFQLPRVATIFGVLGLLVAITFSLVPALPFGPGLQYARINPLLLVAIGLIFLSALSALHLPKGWKFGLVSAPVVLVVGLTSFLSRWYPPLAAAGVGSIAESTLVVSPLLVLVGLTLPFLYRIYHREIPVYSRGLILVGILGILITTVTWHTMRLQYSENLKERAQTQVSQLAAATASAFHVKLALVRRLAERWEVLDGTPSEQLWQQEVSSYLRDFPEMRLIALLDRNLNSIRVESRTLDYRVWLDSFLAQEETRKWFEHVVDSKAPHLSWPLPDRKGRAHAVISVPATPEPGNPWPVVAVVDLHHVYQGLTQQQNNTLNVAVFYEEELVYDTSPNIPKSEQRHLASAVVEAHHDNVWRIDAYIGRGSLPTDELYLPPLILFGGLGLSFLVMLIHLFWRESERRSVVLTELNDTLNYHLEEERSLRQTNEKIMEFSRDLLCSISPAGRFLTVSPASEAMLGYAPGELKGRHYNLLLLPEDRDSTVEEVRKLASGQSNRASGFRTRLRHRDGHTVTVSWTAEWSQEDNALFCVGRDISDELVAETLSRERDQFFSLSPDMFCIVDLNSHFFEVNNTFVETLGYTREQLLGTSYLEVIHTDDHRKVNDAVQSLTEGEDVHNLFIRAIDTAQNEHWLQINAILSGDDLIYVVARDITESLETQERLRRSEALLSIAEKTAMIGGWTVEIPPGKVAWTPVMFDIFEVPPGEEPDLETGLSFYTDDSRATLSAAIDLCASTGIPFDEEVQFRTASGRVRWGRAIGHAVKNEKGEIVRLQGGFQDITASRQAMDQIRRYAERQATIFESITDAFFTVDKDWRFTYVNRRSEEILHKSREELLGHNLWEIFPAAIGTEFDEMYTHAVETGESVSFEGYYAPLDNWLEISAYPSEEGLAVYYRSIRERKEAQWKLEETLKELERSNRELQDFAFVASHDLQEPLRKIRAFSDRLLVKSDKLGPDERDYLERMQSAAARMQSLIMDLLSYSRITTRAKPFETCDTEAILKGVLQDMETAIAAEQANITISPLPSISGDATQLRQVFQNLISNSIKFHEPGKPPEIMIYPEDISQDSWTLVVSDNGIGFDEKYAEKIFHPFQRLHKRDAYSGTGIGMAIVKKILNRHGASVRVQSAPGEGTTFRIRFRRHETAEGIHYG
jgi:PAS domain S-box-containing protein